MELPMASGIGEQGTRFHFYEDAGPGCAGGASEIQGFGGRLGLIGEGRLIARRKGVPFLRRNEGGRDPGDPGEAEKRSN
jgi:hypothetical protein